ncbi:MAG: hypothetical protein KatS3mg057_2879 [Herpetosiphonaceae bacterium]|nr:MAG: hypothetical protein KatS3mg057_2879 [Herpetosiphonaceae bacterium]
MWGSFLIGDVPVVSPIVKHATKTITNVATRAFSGRGPGAAGRIKTRYGTLTINRGQKKGAIEAVRPNIVIGARGDIQLNDIGISRNHARIQIEGDQVALVDLDSTNGTFLRRDNQVQPLNGVPMPLQHGDLIYLGDPDLPTSIELLYQRQEV